jgi:hypothetical protein
MVCGVAALHLVPSALLICTTDCICHLDPAVRHHEIGLSTEKVWEDRKVSAPGAGFEPGADEE